MISVPPSTRSKEPFSVFFFKELATGRFVSILLFLLFLFVPVSHDIHSFYKEDAGQLGTEHVLLGKIIFSHLITLFLNLIVLNFSLFFHLFFWAFLVPVLLYVVILFVWSYLCFLGLRFPRFFLYRLFGFRWKSDSFKKNCILLLVSVVLFSLFLEFFLSHFYPQILSPPVPSAIEKKNICYFYFDNEPIFTDNYLMTDPLQTRTDANGTPHFLRTNSSAGINHVPSCTLIKRGERGQLVTYSFNKQGFRMNDGVSLTTPSGKKRIFIVGDSFAFGAGNNQTETISYFLQSFFNESVEVINGGVSGFSSLQSYLMFSKEYVHYKPDVVIFLHDMNDIVGNLVLRTDYIRPIYVPTEKKIIQNALIARSQDQLKTSHDSFYNPLVPYSHLLTLLHTNKDSFLAQKRILYNTTDEIHQYLTYQKDPPWALQEGFDFNCAGVLKPFSDAVTNAGGTFLVVYIPTNIELNGHAFNATINGFINATPDEFDSSLPRTKIMSCLKNYSIPSIDLYPFFKRYGNLQGLYNTPIGGHWSPQGTNFSAQVISLWLKRKGVV